MNKFKKIAKIAIISFLVMVVVILLGLIGSITLTANGDNIKYDETATFIAYNKNDMYGNFMTELYPMIIEKKIDFNKLPMDSIKMYLNEILNLCPNITPIKTIDSIEISSKFGGRTNPISKKYQFHQGIDIRASIGTKIKSTMSGEVTEIHYQAKDTITKYESGYGNYIVINNSFGYETLYAHLSRIYVKKGQNVLKGQPIGTLGLTGNSTGPNLHYEIHKNGELKDPLSNIFMRFNGELLVSK